MLALLIMNTFISMIPFICATLPHHAPSPTSIWDEFGICDVLVMYLCHICAIFVTYL